MSRLEEERDRFLSTILALHEACGGHLEEGERKRGVYEDVLAILEEP